MSNEQEMKSNHFFELCQALPEGVNWIDPITPQIADAIWQAATLAAEARIRELEADAKRYRWIEGHFEEVTKYNLTHVSKEGERTHSDSYEILTLPDSFETLSDAIDAALTEHKENQG